MSFKQSFGRARLSLVLVGVFLGACGDDGDSSSDDQAQSADAGDSTAAQAARSGSSGTARAGSGGSKASTTASGGRSGSAGQTAASSGQKNPQGGSGGRASTAANGGGNAGGSGGGGATPTQDAGTTIPSDQDAGDSRLSLTDDQIAAVLSAVNTAEIGAGTFALTRATTPAARDYAQSMVDMHTAAQERQTALFGTLNLTLVTSALTTQLTDESTATMTQLMTVSDAEFDAAYLNAQAAAHTEVLTVIDEQLLPNVVADTLRAELVLTRTTVAEHLDAARAAIAIAQDDTDAGVIITP